MNDVDVKFFKVGYCLQNEKFSISKGENKVKRFYALVVLIKHEKFGYILYDTGYSSHVINSMKKFPFNIYAKITPIIFDQEDELTNQLNKIGIKADDIKLIILSHFHPDHIGGVNNFPNAKFLYSRDGYSNLAKKKGLIALVKGFIPELLPDDFDNRTIELENEIVLSKEYIPFDKGFDVLGDKSLILVNIDGHAKGQLGLFVKSKNYIYFFIADACWDEKSFIENLPPPRWVHFFIGNNKKYCETLNKIHKLYKLNSNIKIIPSHSKRIWENV